MHRPLWSPAHHEGPPRSDVMRLLQHIASILLLIGLLCPAAQAAGQPDPLADEIARQAAAKWMDVLARMDSEEETLAACRASPDSCSPPARRLLKIVELGRQRAGRARLGEINRAVNLSIRATSDWSQYGVDDFWSTPLATLEKGAGDCEDYAILKYLALREAGVSPDDLRLLIVSYPRRRTMHAVLAVHWDEEWLLLDNLTMVMVNSLEATQYQPLIALDYQAMTTFAAGSPTSEEPHAQRRQVRRDEVRFDEVRPAEVRPGELRVAEVRLDELRLPEVRLAEV